MRIEIGSPFDYSINHKGVTMRNLFDMKKLIKRMPEFLRLQVLRRTLVIPRLKKDEVIFKLATTSEELAQAYSLLHDSYVKEGYMTAAQSGLRCTIFHALPGSAVLVAKKGETVIATVTLIKDSSMGLPSDKEYFNENEGYREKGFRLCEVSALAIHPEFRAGLITFHLIKFLWHYSADILDVNMLCCVVNPKALDFYKAYLNFQRNGHEISYDFVLGAKGVHITRDLTNHKAWMKKTFHHLKPKSNLYSFFYEEKSSFIFPEATTPNILSPTFTKETFENFFCQRTDVLKTADPKDFSLVKSAYQIYFDFTVGNDLLDTSINQNDKVERAYRYPSAIPAVLYSKEVSIVGRITDLGANGLFFNTTAPIALDQTYEIIFKAGDDVLFLEVEPRWKTSPLSKRHVQGYGLRFVQPPQQLHAILRQLHEQNTNISK